jgi:hypothetical protein
MKMTILFIILLLASCSMEIVTTADGEQETDFGEIVIETLERPEDRGQE